jgi:crotonobetainyl-CoA:carnitine CoA-transferase CaiB-like acyl-CoA transferase
VTGPCDGLSVVEVAVGTSVVGLGLAGGVPGMMLADLGARVTRVVGSVAPDMDEHVEWGTAWHRDKDMVVTDDPAAIRSLLGQADVAFVYGPEHLVEGRGLGYWDLQATCPDLVYARCRPSRTSAGTIEDFGSKPGRGSAASWRRTGPGRCSSTCERPGRGRPS